jgi:hypothetical protein
MRVGFIWRPALVEFFQQNLDSRRVMPSFTPHLLRLRHAPTYLGMNKNAFNRLVRPNVRVIALGQRGIAFDRLELGAWAEEYCRRNGRPAARVTTDYSAAELRNSLNAANRLKKFRKSPGMTVLRLTG